jgi:hypothetical protein
MTITDPKTEKSNQKKETSGVGARRSQIRKLTSHRCSEAPNFGFNSPDSLRANANYNNLGNATTLQKSLIRDSMLGMMQKRSKSGKNELSPTNLPIGFKSRTPSMDNSMRSIAKSEAPSLMAMTPPRKSGATQLDQSRSFHAQIRNSVPNNPTSTIKDNIMQKSVTRSQNRRVLFNQVSKIGDSMLKSQVSMKSILEQMTIGS